MSLRGDVERTGMLDLEPEAWSVLIPATRGYPAGRSRGLLRLMCYLVSR